MLDIEALAGTPQAHGTNCKPSPPAFSFWQCPEYLTLSIHWPSLSKPSGPTYTRSQRVKIVPEYKETGSCILAIHPAVSQPLALGCGLRQRSRRRHRRLHGSCVRLLGLRPVYHGFLSVLNVSFDGGLI